MAKRSRKRGSFSSAPATCSVLLSWSPYDLLVHLAVDVKDRVRRGEDGFDGRLVRGGGHAAAHGQHDLDIVARIDAPAGHETVDAGAHGDHTDVGRNEQMQVAEALVALEALLAQPAVGVRDLNAVLKLIAGVVLRGHDVGHEFVKRCEGLDQAAVLAVAETAFAFHESTSEYANIVQTF